MADNVYEGLFILDGNKYARDHEALPSAVEKMITELGGEIKVSRLWEERRLAYAIKGQRKGAYWLVYFQIDSQQITPLNRKCELRDGVLRHLILKIHPRLVEPIIEHAQHAPAPAEGDGDGETSTPAPATADA